MARNLADPVFRDLFEREEHDEILRLLPVAVSSSHARDLFDPLETLLAARRHGEPGREEEAVLQLLELARDAAGNLDRVEEEAALAAQISFLREPFHWERARAVLGELAGVSPSIARRFEGQWRENQERSGAPEWTGELLDAFFQAEGRAEAFAEAMGRRLEEDFAPPEPGLRRISWSPAPRTTAPAALALEIATKSDRRHHPALFAYLDRIAGDRSPSSIRTARRRALNALRAEALLPRIVEWFRDRLPELMPDPGTGSGDYDDHAAALAALRELDPAAAERILAGWQADHRRRRNLWAALKENGF